MYFIWDRTEGHVPNELIEYFSRKVRKETVLFC